MKKTIHVILSLLVVSSAAFSAPIGLTNLRNKLDISNELISKTDILVEKNKLRVEKISIVNAEIEELSREYKILKLATGTNEAFASYFGGDDGVLNTNKFEVLTTRAIELVGFLSTPSNEINDVNLNEAKYTYLGRLGNTIDGLLKIKADSRYIQYGSADGVVPSTNYANYVANIELNKQKLNKLASVLPNLAGDWYVVKSDTDGLNRRGLEVSYNLNLDANLNEIGFNRIDVPPVVMDNTIATTIPANAGTVTPYPVIGAELSAVLATSPTLVANLENQVGLITVDAGRYAVPVLEQKALVVVDTQVAVGSACSSPITKNGVSYIRELGEITESVVNGVTICNLRKQSCNDINNLNRQVEKACPYGFVYMVATNSCVLEVNVETAQLMGSQFLYQPQSAVSCPDLVSTDFTFSNTIQKDTRWKLPVDTCERTKYVAPAATKYLHVKYFMNRTDNGNFKANFSIDTPNPSMTGGNTLLTVSDLLNNFSATIDGVASIAIPVMVMPDVGNGNVNNRTVSFALSGLGVPSKIYKNDQEIFDRITGQTAGGGWGIASYGTGTQLTRQVTKVTNPNNNGDISGMDVITYVFTVPETNNNVLTYTCSRAYCGILDTKEVLEEDLTTVKYAAGVNVNDYTWAKRNQSIVYNNCANSSDVYSIVGTKGYCYSKETGAVKEVTVLAETATAKTNTMTNNANTLSAPVSFNSAIRYQEPCNLLDGYRLINASEIFKGVDWNDDTNVRRYSTCQMDAGDGILIDQPIQTEISGAGETTILVKQYGQSTNDICYSLEVRPRQTIMPENTSQSLGEKIGGFKINPNASSTMVDGGKVLTTDAIGNTLNESPYYCFNMKDEGGVSTRAYFYNDYFAAFKDSAEYADALIKYTATGLSGSVDMASITATKPDFVRDVIIKPMDATPPSITDARNNQQSVLNRTATVVNAVDNEMCVIFNDNLAHDHTNLDLRNSGGARLLTISQKDCPSAIAGSTQVVPGDIAQGCKFIAQCEVGYSFDGASRLCKKVVTYNSVIQTVWVSYPDAKGIAGAVGEEWFRLGTTPVGTDIGSAAKANRLAVYARASARALGTPVTTTTLECSDGSTVALGQACSVEVTHFPLCEVGLANVYGVNVNTALTTAANLTAPEQYICQFFPTAEYGTILAVMPKLHSATK